MAPADAPADWLIVGAWEQGPQSAAWKELDSKLGGILARLIEHGDITGKAKELVPILDTHSTAACRVLVMGLGARDRIDLRGLVAASAAAARYITSKAYDRVALAMPAGASGLGAEAVAAAVGIGFMQGSEGPGLRKAKPERFEPKELWLIAATATDTGAVAAGA